MLRSLEKSMPLHRLERWFQTRIYRPQERAHASLPSPRPEKVLLPSRHLEPGQRLDIYSDMYFARLHDCLAEDYPTLRQMLGAAKFESLARAYLARFPSKHYSLNRLGNRLPQYLESSGKLRRVEYAVAALENAMSEVFGEEDCKALGEKEFRAVPARAWAHARLRLIPALRLMVFEHSVNAAVSAARREKPLPRIARKASWIAVYRKDARVWRMEISQPMYETLRALSRGQTLSRAVDAFAKSWKGAPGELATEMQRAFREWAREGFFASITTSKKTGDLP